MLDHSPRQLERLLHLDELIRQGQGETAKQLAEAVSERTLHTDLNFLKDRFQAPLENSRRKGYFYTDPDWRLPTMPLTQGELFALILGSRMLEAAAGMAYAQELASALEQLVRRLPEQTWVDHVGSGTRWKRFTILDEGGHSAPPDTAWTEIQAPGGYEA